MKSMVRTLLQSASMLAAPTRRAGVWMAAWLCVQSILPHSAVAQSPAYGGLPAPYGDGYDNVAASQMSPPVYGPSQVGVSGGAPLSTTGAAHEPILLARPFDTGPQAGRSRQYPHPLDALGVPPAENYWTAPPYPADPFVGPPPPGSGGPFEPYQLNPFGQGDGGCNWCGHPWCYSMANAHVTWVQGTGDGLGFVEFERRFLISNPYWGPLRLVPGFNTRYVDGPRSTDLPAYLTEISLEAAATYQLDDGWVLDLGIRPSFNGDLHYLNYDTFRLQGHAVMSRQIDPITQAVIGFAWLSREDIPVLPVAGFIIQPNPDVKWELVFPRPRLAVRVGGGPTDNGWLYVKGELGGNSWAIERENGHRDVATYRDLRLIGGYELVLPNAIAIQAEAGWVFSRHLEYASNSPDFSPRDTFLLRLGINY